MDDFYHSIAAEVFVSDFSVIDRKNNRVLYTSLSEQSLIGWLLQLSLPEVLCSRQKRVEETI